MATSKSVSAAIFVPAKQTERHAQVNPTRS